LSPPEAIGWDFNFAERVFLYSTVCSIQMFSFCELMKLLRPFLDEQKRSDSHRSDTD